MTDAIANLDAVRARGLGVWPDPDWSILQDAMPAAPVLPVSAFGAASDYLIRAARGANVAPDYPAAMLLSAVGAIVGKVYSVRVASGWFEPLAFWSVLVGPPSSGKTPSAKPIRRKLADLQKLVSDDHRRQVEAELAKAEIDKAPNAEIDRLKDKLTQPPRHVVNDSTAEALARIEARSPRGLLVERDELSGLIEGLERYSAGVDRAFYLEGWNDGAFTLDRVKAGTIAIQDHSFSIAGGIQPDRFRSLLTHSGDDDGFSARLLIFWPELVPAGPIPAGADHSVMEAALEAIHLLPDPLDGGRRTLKLDPAAFAALDSWFQSENAGRRGILGKRGSAFGKLPGYAARLAGALHILNWAFGSVNEGFSESVPEAQMLAALILIESYFVPQIERAYHGADRSPDEQTAGAILSEALKRKATALNLRQVRREWGIPGSRTKDAPALFKGAAMLLTEAGWIRPTVRQGGSSDFAVNPALHGGVKR